MAADDEEVNAHLQRPLADAESVLRDRRAHVRVCAWCNAVFVDGSWFPPSSLLTASWRMDPRASHTICPECFAVLAPGRPYPNG